MGANAGTLVRTYRMADKQAQMLIAGLLNGMSGLTAHHRDTDGYVALEVECASIGHANSAARLVQSIDPSSVLVKTTNVLDSNDLVAG
jgi:hypothetical protein